MTRKPKPRAKPVPAGPRRKLARPSYGWAIAVDGVIDVTTVYPTARGAMVNWMVAHGVTPTAMWADGAVAEIFRQTAARSSAKELRLVQLSLRERREKADA